MTARDAGHPARPLPPLRRATAADLAAVTALKRAAYARNRELLGVEPLPLLVHYAAVLADPSKETWLCGAAGALEGCLVLELRPADLLVESLAVAPGTQGAGIGRRLLDAAIARAFELRRPAVRLYTGTPLVHLVEWYGRHGFAVERVEALADRSITHMVRHLST